MSLRKEGNKIKGKKREADWWLLIARPPVGAREKGGEGASSIARVEAKQYSMPALSQARRDIYMYAKREAVF